MKVRAYEQRCILPGAGRIRKLGLWHRTSSSPGSFAYTMYSFVDFGSDTRAAKIPMGSAVSLVKGMFADLREHSPERPQN